MIKHVFKSIWIALRSFSLGLLIGLLAAPRKGSETRQIIYDRSMRLFDGLMPSAERTRFAGSAAHEQGRRLEKEEYWESGAAPEDRPIDLEGDRARQRGESEQIF
ncbi:MAG: hypothetical protein KatS3mg057_2948 [Herpetosiphonaceae bacterium]|nr:MAG: hypothetical protein KatS3mg057_2948 [Herpetosiphonaceae bacterium]